MLTWNLPCTKNDPLASGRIKTWECVCRARQTEPCAYHALKKHCVLQSDWFGQYSAASTTGNVGVVRPIEKKVVSLRQQCLRRSLDENGRCAVGGRTAVLKPSSSSWPGGARMWSRDVLPKCRCYRQACGNNDLKSLVFEAQASAETARRELNEMREMFREAFVDEVPACSATQSGSSSKASVLKSGGESFTLWQIGRRTCYRFTSGAQYVVEDLACRITLLRPCAVHRRAGVRAAGVPSPGSLQPKCRRLNKWHLGEVSACVPPFIALLARQVPQLCAESHCNQLRGVSGVVVGTKRDGDTSWT